MNMNKIAKIEYVPIWKVKNNPNNPRLVKDDKFKKLVNSIKEFPDMLDKRPIIVNEDMIVLGGNMRLKACNEAGLKEIPIIVTNWTEEQQRQFIIKDNLGYGEWDWDMIANEWDENELNEWGLDIPNFEGDMVELDAVEDDFDAPEGGLETDIVLGDLFEIGEHRLLCGDSTDSDSVAKLMDEQKADMVFTDPPYNINYGNIKHPKFKQRDIENDNMSSADFKNFCNSFVSNIKLFCDGVVYCWAGPGKDGRIMFTALDEALHNSTMIVWNKDQFTLGRGKYQNKNEVCWFGWNKSGETFTDDRTLTNVWDFERPKKSELHPTMKPIKLVENGLNHNPKAKSVLDLFLGSGSTMVAAHQLKRKCYGMELDPKYCQVIVDRMRKLDPALVIKKNGQVI
jgi:DNA modification methylase